MIMSNKERSLLPEELQRLIAFFEILMRIDRRERLKESKKQNQ